MCLSAFILPQSSRKYINSIQNLHIHWNRRMSEPAPGDGIRSLKSTRLFRAINYELYVKPNLVVMALGLTAIIGCSGYIIYMRSKYEEMGYYTALESDGKETFKKKESRWAR